jgi:hypothetical protein
MTYIQYIPQSYRKEKTMSINHTTIISVNYRTAGLFMLELFLSHVQFCSTMKMVPRRLFETLLFSYFSQVNFSGGRDRVERLAKGWTVQGSGPCGGVVFRSRPDWPRNSPSLLYRGYQVFRGVKSPASVFDLSPSLQVEWSCISTFPL